MPVTHVTTNEEFTDFVTNTTHEFVFVDFYADWCGPCKRIAPTLEVLSKEYKTVLFLKVNVDELEDLSAEYGVSAMPTFLVFKTGSLSPAFKPICGASEEKIRALLKTATEKQVQVTVSEDF